MKHSKSRKKEESVPGGNTAGGEGPIRMSDYLQLRRELEDSEQSRHDLEERLALLQEMQETQQRAHASLARSEAFYRALVENIDHVIFSADVRGIVTYISPVIVNISGLTPEEVVGRHFNEFVHEDDRAALMAAFQRNLAGHPEPHDFRVWKKCGGFRDVRASARLLMEGGRMVGLTGAMSDITERRQAEEALRRSEDFLDKIIENIPAMLFVKEVEGLRFVRFNKAGEELLGYSREELLGKGDYDLWPKAQADFFTSTDREMLRNKELVDIPEEPIQTRHKGTRILHTTKIPVLDDGGIPLWVVGICEDITERKRLQAREQMRVSVLEKLIQGDPLQDILDSVIRGIEAELNRGDRDSSNGGPEGIGSILLLDKERKHLLHGAAPNLPGFFNEEVHGLEIGPGVGSCGAAAFTGKRVIVEDIQSHPYWSAYREIAARAGLASSWSEPIVNRMGQVIGTFAIYHRERYVPTLEDVELIQSVASLTGVVIEHKQAEEEIHQVNAELEHRVADRTRKLAESEERMRLFFERQLVGMAITSPEKGWVKVNDKLCEMLGYSREELACLNWAELTCPEDLAADVAQFERVINGEIDSYTLEKRFIRKDGELVFVTLSIGCVRRPDRSVDYFLMLAEDITQRKRAEREAEEALQKEVILRREIHHRVKNNLQVIISLLYLQSLKTSDPNSLALLKESQARVGSIALVHEMLYQREDLTKISFPDYARQLATDLFITYRVNQQNVALKIGSESVYLSLSAAIPCGIIVTELITNAFKYAFPEGRKGEIEISLLPVANSQSLALIVRDNGAGLPKDLDVKRAQTMGLNLVRDLTLQLNGTLEFREGDNGEGTEVRITFPEGGTT